ncbi:methyltransferase domain-containing protein, partial [Candidatus Woesearchaeota archaeon]|nr:methyltransferase domain-containing protein [Candidatus Woesearchaeota archaeon]
FDSGKFDAVIFVASLQFIDDYSRALQETARVLKPNGKLLAMLLNPKSEFFREKMKQLDSYIRKIKHPYVFPIYRSVQKIFCDVRKEHYLGIQHNRFFKCRNTRLATLCIIKGKKK